MTTSPSLSQFALVMVRIGLTSFGGGMSGWMLRVMVQDKRWIPESEFLAGLGLCQVLPGINVVNLAVWLGYRFHGGIGALLGACAIVVPPGLLILVTVTLLTRVADDPWVAAALAGVAASAIGLGASMGVRAARNCLRLVPFLIMAATFVGVGVLRLPMLWVLAVTAPLALLHAWRQA